MSTRAHFARRAFAATIAIAVFVRPATAEPALLPDDLVQRGWIQLFDGETLFGWQTVGHAEWQVTDGVVRTTGDKPGFLMTTSEFADYELSVEFLASNDTNSGIFLRTPLAPTDPSTDCYELNIAPADNPFPTGGLVARKKIEPQKVAGDQAGEWHTFLVTASGGTLTIDLDGERVLVYDDPKPVALGHIGLQSNQGAVAFRNVRLRPLGLKSIFNGQDLTGWNTKQRMNAEFSVTESGELHVKNGRGQLESDGQYANFVLQLECRVNGDGLNSGIFFRSIPGQFVQGYESQISNTTKGGDRNQPADFGTGGIYRRKPARRVVANDGEWFAKTLIANGPRIAVWVDGFQVTDWVDERPASDNPREGKRLAAGTLAIQAHDPTTDFFFRNVRIVELPR